MAALTIEVPDRVAEVVAELDGPLVADACAVEQVIRWNLHEVERRVSEVADEADVIDFAELRRLAQRLESLADAAEATA